LKSILGRIIPQGRKVLIFSQFTKMLDILESFLDYMKYEYVRIDGSTDVLLRQEIIDEFNSKKEIQIFLLSTKAAGVGVNLHSADTVIFYDLNFNPQVDRQAEDRCHRLGNVSECVDIIKLLAKDTVEDYILKIANDKQELHEKLFEEGNFTTLGKQATSSSKYILQFFQSVFEDIKT